SGCSVRCVAESAARCCHRPTYAVHQTLRRFGAEYRLPAASIFTEFAEEGGLMSYAASEADVYDSVASFVDKILNGAKPADLPVAQPTKYELTLNLKTAKALGLTIPRSLLLRADQVIE